MIDRALIRRVAARWAHQLEQRKRIQSTADSEYRTLDEIIDEELGNHDPNSRR